MSGIYTKEQLLAIWVSATDSSYNEPFLRMGEGNGLEAYTQAFAQYERVSRAVNNVFQSLYLLPYSGQTAEPASGESKAKVALKLNRSQLFDRLVLITRGFQVEEIAFDHSTNGTIEVRTNRKYATDDDAIYLPGSALTIDVQATATIPGWGHNNPLPESIRGIVQSGVNLIGAAATVEVGFPGEVVTAEAGGDSFYLSHVGQYLQFTDGPNLGKVRRIAEYLGATSSNAGQVRLDTLLIIYGSATTAFKLGDEVMDMVTGARGIVVYQDSATLVLRKKSGTFGLAGPIVGTPGFFVVSGFDMTELCYALQIGLTTGIFSVDTHENVTQDVTGATGKLSCIFGGSYYIIPTNNVAFDGSHLITGATSGATMEPIFVGIDPMLTPDLDATTSWRIMDWTKDFGISFTNDQQPSAGRSGMLDARGWERQAIRVIGETDDNYRERIAKLGDVVTPRAIVRAATRNLKPLGVKPCFREVGQEGFRGFYYDVPRRLAPKFAFAYDLDFDARPQDAWKVWLDYTDFRAFFIIGVPPTGMGEFGFAYDNHPKGAYDSNPFWSFYDGFPYQSGTVLKTLWTDINLKKAGGVGFALFEERNGCPNE